LRIGDKNRRIPLKSYFSPVVKSQELQMGQERFAEVVFLRLALPGQPERNVGLFLLDRGTGNLFVRVRDDWDRIVAPDEAELLSQLSGDFQRRIQELDNGGGERFLQSLEEQLSNILRLSNRETVRISNIRAELDRLFDQNCAAA
jgi:hypothetical protein